jgi:hypothetical protein
MKRSDGFAERARRIIRELGSGGAEVASQAVADRMDLVFDREKRILYGALSDMVSRGELQRVRPGAYLYIKDAVGKPFEKREVMWRVLRARRKVTARYLAMQAGCGLEYAREWLGALARQEIVRRTTKSGVEGEYRLIAERVEMPGDEAKAERLRNLRELRKAANAAIDKALKAHTDAYNALVEARMAVNGMEE